MNTRPKVLVLLASYNGELFIEEQIYSILNQNDVSVEIVISDDGSSDKTLEIINKFMLEHKNISLLENKNSSNNFNLNFYNLFLSARKFNYDYVAFSDQDDIFLINKFIKQIKLINDTCYVGCSTSVRCIGASSNILKQSNNLTMYDYIFEGAGQGCTFLIKKLFFNDFCDYIEKNQKLIKDFFFHDWLCYLYFRASNKQWYFLNECLVKYRIHNENTLGNKLSFKGIKNRLLKLFNGWYFNQVLLANKISNNINPKIPVLLNANIFLVIYVLIIQGRRNLIDRLIAFFPLIYFFIKKNIKM